jgi:hypothetical protein
LHPTALRKSHPQSFLFSDIDFQRGMIMIRGQLLTIFNCGVNGMESTRQKILYARALGAALAALVCALAIATGAFASTIQYQYTTLIDPLAGTSFSGGTFPSGISGNTIVGTFIDSDNVDHGFVYNGSTFTTIDDPLAVGGTSITGVSGNTIVGTYSDASGVTHGFIYNGSTFTTVDDPFASETYGFGTFLNAVSDATAAGTYYNSTGTYGFTYNGSTFQTISDPSALLPADGTKVLGIQGNTIVGTYVGWIDLPLEGQVPTNFGFIYDGSKYTELTGPSDSGMYVFATAISGNLILGNDNDGMGPNSGFIYNGLSYSDLFGPSQTSFFSGIDGTTIVGDYIPNGIGPAEGFIGVPLPEPCHAAILGFAALALCRRYRPVVRTTVATYFSSKAARADPFPA